MWTHLKHNLAWDYNHQNYVYNKLIDMKLYCLVRDSGTRTLLCCIGNL